MQSSGGLSEAQAFRGKDAILSGPAGGIVGMVRTAYAAGFERVIGFDMGGTSTDVSHYAGTFERAFETTLAGIRVRSQMMSIHTIAAGGGSILSFDGARLRVGPDSAGANPGPASYRRGGPLCVTDANVFLGKLQPEYFPRVFGPGADEALDTETVNRLFQELAQQISSASGRTLSAESIAAGCLQIAVQSMASAIKRISIARGYDVTAYTLQCFGGAGGQHACLVADALGMKQIFVHPLAGVLSAYGMGLADQSVIRESSIELQLDPSGLESALRLLDTLSGAASAALASQGVAAHEITVCRNLNVRYQGTDTALTVPIGTLEEIRMAFEEGYRRRYAFVMEGRTLMIDSVWVEALGQAERPDVSARASLCRDPEPAADAIVRMYAGEWHDARLFVREKLPTPARVFGPAIIADDHSTTLVEAGWEAHIQSSGAILLQRVASRQTTIVAPVTVDPILLEVFNNLFMNIAEQMGLQLQSTAYSVNIKERLDFSCALFDGTGQLIANAPHMPVHLGSMSESIKNVIDRNPHMRRGDVYMLNDPYHGGTHLPDVTVVTPVYVMPGERHPQFYVASRGHHADIGGITPGSMPPFSRSIEEEGILFDNFLLVRDGQFQEDAVARRLASGPYPARNPSQTIADLKAQIAANEKGAQELAAMVAQFGVATVRAYMQHVQDNAEESVRRVVAALQDGEFTLPLDNGAKISVKVTVDPRARQAIIDFTGTSSQLPNNFNAPKSIIIACVLYVFRTLVEDAIPLNAGCLKPLHVIVPEGCMLNPLPPAAVVAGNVETSTCVTNALYGALGAKAASQLTMNNFTFGNDEYQYYETIAGGSGAGAGYSGTSVVQTHMTNSRLTDPELLESRFPVVLESFDIRPGSGGKGRWNGGNGGTRRIRFLQKMTASLLSNGRIVPAFGMAGGGPGGLGRGIVERADGRVEILPHIASVTMDPGDVFTIETPGGGGYGLP